MTPEQMKAALPLYEQITELQGAEAVTTKYADMAVVFAGGIEVRAPGSEPQVIRLPEMTAAETHDLFSAIEVIFQKRIDALSAKLAAM